ncbi:RHS repeat domain-containing protein [Phocaeicola massiliensis]
MCNLVRGDYSMHESVFRTPDKVGNLYREDGCKGREYDRGGRLLWDGEYHYRYDCEGNLVHKSRRDVPVPENNGHTGKKGWLGMLFSADDVDTDNGSKETTPFACWQPGDTCYEWQANGMLAGVRTPDGRTVTFGYDALGRRVSKRTGDTVHRFGWDGNVVLHEWDIEEADSPKLVTDETGSEEYDGTEKPDNLVTWVYDGTSFTPVAKVTDGERYTIVHDYLGTPTQAYDSKGELVWEMLLDVYGKVAECHGDRTLVPFRYQGQYEDEETGLYYNRFRYYSPDMGMYISSDPIGLAGNNPTLYGYVLDVNTWLDILGLEKCANVEDGVLKIKRKFSKGSKESDELEDFVSRWNKQIPPDGLTRQPVSRELRKKASDAANKYRIDNPELFKSGQVAGHIPDVGWGGNPQGPFVPISSSVNSYLGGATQAVPVGTTYTSVIIID